MNTKRKFLAVSVKHSEYKWKFGMPLILWGWKRTEDHELRCFSNYTQFLQKAAKNKFQSLPFLSLLIRHTFTLSLSTFVLYHKVTIM